MNTENNIEIAASNYSESLGVEIMPGLWNLYCPETVNHEHVRDIADVLFEQHIIDHEDITVIRSNMRRSSDNVISYITQNTNATEADILKAKASLYGIEYKAIYPDEVDKDAFAKLSIDRIREIKVLPVGFENNELIVATPYPESVFILDDVKRKTDMDLKLMVCSEDDILNVCDTFTQEVFDIDIDGIVSDISDVEVVKDEEEDSGDLEKMAGQSPVIKFVNYLISNAIHEKASDIHIEPKEKHTKLRYRIDGRLFESMQIPAKMHPAVVSRLKIMSNLDISERRLPQDGKVAVIVGGRSVDLRVSILPTSHGEKVVIRILDSKSILRGLDSSGMDQELIERFKTQVNSPNGILLVTGPTGSGKSTTLYSALGMMDGNSLNVSTVEDPVEYDLEFCNQIQVNDKIGMSFAAALRSLLRQDPDIIMIGEIRDSETAQIAVRAALTGHLVLSTLHTNDAPSSVTRLVNIGVDPYLIAAALNGVLAQRLVRKICEHCKEEYWAPDNIREVLNCHGIEGPVYHGKGCDKCRESGYSGRLGIFEYLELNNSFREVINSDCSIDNMKRVFVEQGNKTMFMDGLTKVQQGLTTVEEILRVTQA